MEISVSCISALELEEIKLKSEQNYSGLDFDFFCCFVWVGVCGLLFNCIYLIKWMSIR